jgi:DNA-binding transcriptional MerR regulator
MDGKPRQVATSGALSKQTGCNVETIRYYERIGILPNPPRGGSGHRVYGHQHLKRLSFVRRSHELGFSLDEVRGLLNLVDGANIPARKSRRSLSIIGRMSGARSPTSGVSSALWPKWLPGVEVAGFRIARSSKRSLTSGPKWRVNRAWYAR